MFGSLINSEHGHLFLSVFEGASSLNEIEPFQKDSALHCLHDLAKVDTSREWYDSNLVHRPKPNSASL